MRSSILFLVPLVFSTVFGGVDFSVYPVPQEMELTGEKFDLEGAEIVFFNGPDKEMADLAGYISHEAASRYQIPLVWRKSDKMSDEGHNIVLGLLSDPEIRASLNAAGMQRSEEWEQTEAYRISVTGSRAVIAGHDLKGLFYGIQSFIQLIESTGQHDGYRGGGYVKGVRISDRPLKSIRGVHVYLPGQEDIAFFKNFIKTMAHFKINTIVIEVGGGMRLDRHPEINVAWEHFCRSFYDMGDLYLQYSEQIPLGPKGRFQASVHTELGGWSWISKAEVRDIVEFAKEHYMNVIPEIQGLTHSYYLALAHRDIAEIPEATWPDSYDPINPKSYELLFDVIDEYLEVFEPEYVHIGHDEWRSGVKGDTGKLFAEDTLKMYRYLKSRGVKTVMWADHFIKGHNRDGHGSPEPPEGEVVWYRSPSTEGAAEIVSAEAKDIIMFNWSWGVTPTAIEQLRNYGWRQIIGNFTGSRNYERWAEEFSREDMLGAEMSTWCLANEFSFGQNGNILNMLFSQNIIWSQHTAGAEELYENIAGRMPEVREMLSGRKLPSLDFLRRKRPGYAAVAVDISSRGNSGKKVSGEVDLSMLKAGKVNYNNLPFMIGTGEKPFAAVQKKGVEVRDIAVESNAASILFLHVSAGKGRKTITYNTNYPEDAAELIGYYRINYEDGFVETAPIRYGQNISEYGGNFSSQLYFAHTVKITEDKSGEPVLAYAYEWVSPRPNRQIRSVDIVGVDSKSGAYPVVLAVTVLKPPFKE